MNGNIKWFVHSVCVCVSLFSTLVSSCWTSSPLSCFSDLQRAAWQPFAHPRKIPLQAVRTWVMAALRLTGSDGSRLMLGHHFAFLTDTYLACVCSSSALLSLRFMPAAAASNPAVFRRNDHLVRLPTVCVCNASQPPQFQPTSLHWGWLFASYLNLIPDVLFHILLFMY